MSERVLTTGTGQYFTSIDLLYKMLKTAKASDLQIKCGSRTFHVHKHVMSMQSKPFAAMIEGNFKEAMTCVINLEDDDPGTVDRMIQYMYTGFYDDTDTPLVQTFVSPPDPAERTRFKKEPDCQPAQEYLINVRRSCLGGKARETVRELIQEFQDCIQTSRISAAEIVVKDEETAEKFVERLRNAKDDGRVICDEPSFERYHPDRNDCHHCSDMPDALMVNTMTYCLAEKYNIPILKTLAVKKVQFCMENDWDLARFASALKYLYENTISSDRGLRDVFIDRAHEDNEYARHCSKDVEKMKKYCLIYNPEYLAVLAEIGEIGVELLRKGTRHPVRFTHVGKQIYLECRDTHCEQSIVCPACKKADFFHEIDEVFHDEKVDLICGYTACQALWSKDDPQLVSYCYDCR